MAEFRLKHGDRTDLPSSLPEGDHFVVTSENNGANVVSPPELYIGPDGGGTPEKSSSTTRTGSINDIPSTLQEGETFAVTEDLQGGNFVNPTTFIGPPGGGTPRMIGNSINIGTKLPNKIIIPKGGGAGFPPNAGSNNDGVIPLSSSPSGYVTQNEFDPTYLDNAEGQTVAFDWTDNAFYHINFRVTDPSIAEIQIGVYDNTGSLIDPSDVRTTIPVRTPLQETNA